MTQEKSQDSIEIEVVYSHPVARVWRALTERGALAHWLMPNDFQPRLGHRFTFRTEPQPGWDGIVVCEVVTLEKPRCVAYTWRGSSDLPETLVTFTLEPAEGGTRLRFVHSGFAQGGPVTLAIRDLLSSGWDATLLRTKLPALLDALAAGEVGAEQEDEERV